MPLDLKDLSKLAGIKAALRELANVPSKVAPKCIAPLNRRIAEMFSRGQDPYGNAWAPLKPATIRRKRGDARILIRTFKLAPGTFFTVASGAGLKLIVGPAGEYAQEGSSNRVPRAVAPAHGLPATWRSDIEKEAVKMTKLVARLK